VNLRDELPNLLPNAIAWAENQSRVGLVRGAPLTDSGVALASEMGVRHPERIRLVTVDALPMPEDATLRRAALDAGLLGPGFVGLTLGYAIFVREGHGDRRVLAHECRHVAQYESFGSIGAFLTRHLADVVRFGYADSPLERDARAWEGRVPGGACPCVAAARVPDLDASPSASETMNPPVHAALAVDVRDLDSVRELFCEYAASLPVDLEYQDFSAELQQLPGAYGPPEGGLFIARSGDMDIGCVALRPLRAGVCELKRLYVRPAYRGNGSGSLLLGAAIDTARAHGYDEIRLDTLPTMATAQRLYRAHGFEEIGPYGGPGVPGTRYFALRLRALE
jgi:GNAT superfamily N-acetyltransferase